MRTLADIRARTRKHEIFRGQLQHAMIAALLTVGACSLLHNPAGRYLGISPINWAYITLAVALFHQSMVAVVFRLQLHFDLMVRLFGARAEDLGRDVPAVPGGPPAVAADRRTGGHGFAWRQLFRCSWSSGPCCWFRRSGPCTR